MMNAPAKVNLSLHITGRRDDGYHLLDSLVVFTEFSDRLSIVASKESCLTLDGPQAAMLAHEDTQQNLALRATYGMAQLAGDAGEFSIVLTKHIPAGAGLGGGSADAAAVIRHLAGQYHLPVASASVQHLALSLGADVPACLYGKPLYMRGIGEIVEPAAPLPECALLLINPQVVVPTAKVFAAYKHASLPVPDAWGGGDYAALVAHLQTTRNDLCAAASMICPEIPQIIFYLQALSGCDVARMSGSGASCFGVFPSLLLAQEAAQRLAKEKPAWWCVATRVLSC